MRARLVSWNIHACVGTDGRYDPERIARVLAPLGADAIGLQEVDWRRPRVGGRDQLDLLADRLQMVALGGPCLRDHAGEYGNGLLSAAPILRSATARLPSGRTEPRGAIDVTLGLEGGPLRVLVTHLGLWRAVRRAQVGALLELLDGAPEARDQPTVLVGDLNEWLPLRIGARRLTPKRFPCAFGGASFPSRAPLLRLDRALVRPRPVAARPVRIDDPEARVASDHLPLVLDLEW